MSDTYTDNDACATSESREKDAKESRIRKIFDDPIHGQMGFHPLCVKIIDTPQFQRLRYIKQLGTCYLVFPGASHNRFEHSLGVCHLAGRLLRTIKERQPNDKNGSELITDKDILCVEIAGLCHDLGHGPFSHLFDKMFIPKVNSKSKWKHETASVMMFEYILEDNNGQLLKEFKNHLPDFNVNDIEFIKELICGCDVSGETEWPYKGRTKEKAFLYEVVANKSNGIDVDKWDYLARDCYMLGIRNTFDHNRCISNAMVLKTTGGRNQICYRDKEAPNLYDMFHTRVNLHRKAYQHKTHNIIARMVSDALIAANDHIHFCGKNGEKRRMSEAINDMTAFTKLTDSVLQMILLSTSPDLKTSKDILNNIINRKIYKFVAHTQVQPEVAEDGIAKSIWSEIPGESRNGTDLEDIVIDLVRLDGQDPIGNIQLYRKDNHKTFVLKKEEVSYLLPPLEIQYVRLYCKKHDPTLVNILREAFCNWCVRKGHCMEEKGEQ
ncbi:deoxynucleoside triphosphate triphosphohydrolase SAMHD1-like [Mercenaria mercenaria]|uniref:deoxynucleoside triphosphate triphosphohydrolase SAMHD1-like n=1 Tax=Mercenaria mercenaria TaxID=6596 RepID=UPI00234F84FC|nr:deoxynucleoside triphosphate triphosphohydrolase SAMHD1-like [Mercenaria mercenaria]